MDSEQIEKFKQEIECIIKEKNYIYEINNVHNPVTVGL